MSETNIHLAYERNFDMLFTDSIDFLLKAGELDPTLDEAYSHSRASIIFSLLMLEAAANTCIEHLSLERTVNNEIDRLPVLGKFDFYLRTKFRNKSIDRGNCHVAWLTELRNLRDGLVHLKPHIVEWKGDPKNEMSAVTPRTRGLDIQKNPKVWGFDDAAKVSKGVHGFLSYFFKEKCRYSPTKVTAILFSESEIPGDDNYFYPSMKRITKLQLNRIDVDISYVRISWF